MMLKRLDWTNGFNLEPNPYTCAVHPDKLELLVPVPGVKKADIELKYEWRINKNYILIKIPDTPLSETRDLQFEIGEDYDVKGTKANVRDGVLYMHIPKREESKPNKITIS